MYTVSAKSSVIAVAEPGGSYQSQTTLSQWVEVLVDCPGCSDLFTYKIPEHLQIKPGGYFKCSLWWHTGRWCRYSLINSNTRRLTTRENS